VDAKERAELQRKFDRWLEKLEEELRKSQQK